MKRTRLVRHMSIRGSLAAMVVAVLAAGVLGTKPIPEDLVHPRMTTSLQVLAMQALVQPKRLDQLAKDIGVELEDDVVTVIVEPLSGKATWVDETAVRALGGEVEARSESLLRVRVPVDRLLELPDRVSGIAFIREPFRPRPLATSQGVALTGASNFHAAGYYGQGTKVAIIDLGFRGYTAARTAGELVNVVFTKDYTGSGLETGIVHGTGVAEIVADMAPQAQLYLMKIGDSVDLQNAVSDCIANGVQVVNHSVGWFNTNYYDGTGVVAGIAGNARNNGILWANAAGNEGADGHWQGDFVDGDGDSYHDFGSGSDYLLDGDSLDEGNRVYASAGDILRIYMTWNDWTASDQDYDLFLYDSAGSEVAASVRWQYGTQPPTEAINFAVSVSGNYEIVIRNYDAPATPEIEFFVYRESGWDPNLEHHVPGSSIITPANSAKVMAVGAIYRNNWATGPQESYSSRGPSNASRYAASRTKPDIMGPDGVSSYTYGSFFGTSAASPHVAGAAALLLSEDPSRTADELQAKLESDAIDMGVGGKDNVYGSGRLDLELTPFEPLRGDWRFDEGGGGVAGDASTYGNDGVIYGAGWVTGHSGTGLSLDGVNDYVEIADDASLDVTGDLSIEFWMKCNGIEEASQMLVSKRAGSDWTVPYQMWLDNRSAQGMSMAIRFALGSGAGASIVDANDAVGVGQWAHVLATVSGTTMRIYVDGVEKASGTFTGTRQASDAPVKLGVYPHGGGNWGLYFNGVLDEVKIHAEAIVPGPPASALPQAYAALPPLERAVVMPNPVVDSALFKAEGADILKIRVQIYDLAGTELYDSDWRLGSTLEWDCRDVDGRRVANGAYLYVIWIRDSQGREIVSPVGKVFLLR